METIKFAKSLKCNYVNFSNLIPYPGTEAYDWAEKKSLWIEKIDSAFLFVAEWKVFQVADFFVDEVHDFYAIGSGAAKAMIWLYLWHTVQETIEATCKYDLYCHDPVIVHEVKKINAVKEQETIQ